MMYFLATAFILLLLFVFVFSLAIFIDRFIISSTGISNPLILFLLSLTLLFSLSHLIYFLTFMWPSFFGTSAIFSIFLYHAVSFFVVHFLFVFFTYIVFCVDYFFKTKYKKCKFNILNCDHIYYKNLLNNKKFLIISLVVSYFISTIIILFPMPQFISSFFDSNNVKVINYISSEIKLYQQVFVFTIIPILFSVLKK